MLLIVPCCPVAASAVTVIVATEPGRRSGRVLVETNRVRATICGA